MKIAITILWTISFILWVVYFIKWCISFKNIDLDGMIKNAILLSIVAIIMNVFNIIRVMIK